MKLIKLTQGKFAKVDDEDYDFLMQWKWYAIKLSNQFYAHKGIRNKKGNNDKIIMHRLIMKVSNPKIQVDHIDHDSLNNQKYNLRTCTNSENCRNRNSVKGSSSKYLGVRLETFSSGTQKWRASIRPSKKPIHLGLFPLTPEGEIEAAKAYDKAAKEYYGEFANLNFI